MPTLFSNAQIQKVLLGNGTLLMGTPLADVGPIKGNLSVDATRKVAMFKAGVPQILYKQIATDEDVFCKATLASLDLARVQQILGIGQFTSVAAGNTAVTATVGFNDPDLNANNVGVMLGFPNILASPAPVVRDAVTNALYASPGDYSIDLVDGMITRAVGSTIPASGAVNVIITYAAAAAEVYQFGGLPGVNYVPGQFIHTRVDGKRVIFDMYRMSTAGKWLMEFREVEWNLFDAQWNLIADLPLILPGTPGSPFGRQPGNLYFQIRRET